MIIAARVAIGRCARRGVKNKIVAQTMRPVITEESHVVAQAFRFTAVFEKLPATPYHPKNEDERFASPCQISSLFAERGCFVV